MTSKPALPEEDGAPRIAAAPAPGGAEPENVTRTLTAAGLDTGAERRAGPGATPDTVPATGSAAGTGPYPETGSDRTPRSDTAPEEASGQAGTSQRRMLRRIQYFVGGLFLLLLFWSISLAKVVILPMVMGLLIALTLTPLVRWLKRRGIPAPLTAVALILAIGCGTFYGLYMLRYPAQMLMQEAPTIQQELRLKMWDVARNFERIREASEQMQQLAGGGDTANGGDTVVVQDGTNLLQVALTSVAGLGSSLVVAMLLAMFLLASGDNFQRRLVEAFPRFSDKRRAHRISRDIERQISRYLGAITVINAALGIAIGATLHLLGMPYALLWGVAACLLNFVPYMGAIAGTAAAGAVALVTFDTFGEALLIPLAYFMLTSLEGQLITPWLVGRHLRLNTPAVFVAVVFWAWLWGAAGALLAVPFLVFLKVFCDNIPGLRVFGSFLDGGEPVTRRGRRRARRRQSQAARARLAQRRAPPSGTPPAAPPDMSRPLPGQGPTHAPGPLAQPAK